VTIALVPDQTSVLRGGNLGITITVTNSSSVSQTVQVWTEAILPNGNPYPGNPVIGPRTVTLSPNETKRKHITHHIPNNAPLGDYLYCGKVGTYPSPVDDQDCFTFTVTP